LHTNRQAKEKARRTIPKIWRNLLENEDSDLRNTLATAVQNECGTRPESEDLDQFFREQLHPEPPPSPPTRPRPSSHQLRTIQRAPLRPPSGRETRKIVGYVFNGKENRVGAGHRTLAEILKEFHRTSPEFMPRFATETEGRTRRLVAQNREQLYDKPHLIKRAIDLKNGWWLGSHLSRLSSLKNIKIACRIAGVTFGSQLTLIER